MTSGHNAGNGDSSYQFAVTYLKMAWLDAEYYCQERKQHLMSIASEEDHKNFLKACQDRGIGTAWLGASDRNEEGVWKWNDPGQSGNTFTKWRSGEPNGGRSENCLEFRMFHGGSPGWNDMPCDYQREFACEKGSLRCNGKDGYCCTSEEPCSLGDGNCDSDSDCADGLRCAAGDSCPWPDRYNPDQCCADINECLDHNGGCSQNCINTDGGYHCTCNSGYHLGKDNKTCIASIPYQFVKEAKTWTDAENHCQQLNSHLVSISSEEENNGLKYAGNERGIGDLWIGITDEEDEGNWIWTEPRHRDDKFRNWQTGKPDGGWDKNCGQFSVEDGTWKDADCQDTHSFVCLKGGYRCNGKDSGCCTKDSPCKEGDGRCHSDSECVGSLVCGYENCAWGGDDDCCQQSG